MSSQVLPMLPTSNLDAIASILHDMSTKLHISQQQSVLHPPLKSFHHHLRHKAPSHPKILDFGSKTPYPHPTNLTHLQFPLHDPTAPRLIHVSLIARHGTRNPTNNSLRRLTELQLWLNSVLSPTPRWLSYWSAQLENYRISPGSLTTEGHRELYAIGTRFAHLYAHSLQAVGSTVRLRSSYKERAISSARAFLQGYLDGCSNHGLPPPTTIVLPHKNPAPSSTPPIVCKPSSSDTEAACDPSASDLDSDSNSLATDSTSDISTDDDVPLEILPSGSDAVLRYFERNAEYAQFAVQHKALTRRHLSCDPLLSITSTIATRISQQLGASQAMHPDLVRAVAEAAAFENAHGNLAKSVFCTMLTPSDTAVMEVFEKHHRPLFQMNNRFRAVAAPLVADLARSLRASAEGAGRADVHAADLRFAHAETLMPLLILLGINTNGLSASDPQFRRGLGAVSPFAANLSFELYEQLCGTNKSHFVRLRLHEQYVECIPALGENGTSGVVRLEHLLDYFDGILEEGMHLFEPED